MSAADEPAIVGLPPPDDWDEHWGSFNAAAERNPAQEYRRQLGLFLLGRRGVERAPAGRSDLADLYRALAAAGELFGYPATERFCDTGTPASLIETSAFLASLPRGSNPRGSGAA
jgi:NDP-sugar pyrophosphorylase family protein